MGKIKKKLSITGLIIIIVSILLILTILAGVAIGALVGIVGIGVGIFLLVEKRSYDEREFSAPVDGAFEVTDIVELEFEGYGIVKIELYGKEAPETVKSFLAFVRSGKLDESIISISNSTALDKKMSISINNDYSDNQIKGEFYDNGIANNISHVAGVLTMDRYYGANTSLQNRFMIMLNDHSGEEDVKNEYDITTKYGYDGHYAAFGKVTGGTFSIVEKMASDKNATPKITSTNIKLPENELSFGSNRFTITYEDIKKEKVEYKFIPEVSGKYVFSSSTFMSLLIEKASDGSALDDAKALLGTEQTADAFKAGVEYELEKDVEYKVTVGVKDQKAGTKYIKISGNILFVGTNDIEVKDTDIGENAEDTKSYEFTPKLSGVYFFTGEKDKIADRIEIFYNGVSIGTDYAYLEKDTKYTIEILLNEGDKKVEAGTYDLEVVSPMLAIGDNKLDIPVYDVLKEGKAIYCFTPSKDGKYLFKNESLTISVYDENGNKLEGDYLELKKDVCYKVVLNADLSTRLFIGSNTIALAKASEETTVYSGEYLFAVEQSGKYTFVHPDGISLEVYRGGSKESPIGKEYQLTAGEVYKVVISSSSQISDKELKISFMADKYSERMVNYAKCTVEVQDTVLNINKNELLITQSEIDVKKSEFTFTATTNGPVSFTGFYQRLNENGEHEKNETGGNIYVNAKLTIFDENGKELDPEYAMLTEGETYKVVLKTDLIKKGSICTITVKKIPPRIIGANIVYN